MGEYAHPEVLVTTQWVSDHGRDPNLRLVEVDVDTSAYDQGHLAGAVGWNWQTQLQDGVRRDILDKTQFESLMSRSGITPDTTVVLYGDNNNWFAAYAFWQMKYYGHKDVRLMNGGRKLWQSEKRPMTQEAPQVKPATYGAPNPDASLRALRDDVLAVVNGRSREHLVDVRSVDEFSGKVIAPPGMTETAQRGGHIPAAVNVPWSRAVQEDGTFKSLEDLQKIYREKGVEAGGDVIAYCRIGERSSHTWFVLKYLLGHKNVRNYDGSWTEWGNLVGAPIEKESAAPAS
ncbi:MAG TPA: sulfurtransferase [Patescibacteria group bacterium]|nr:sulfurtransferase [Patescibacteria group bacterium]